MPWEMQMPDGSVFENIPDEVDFDTAKADIQKRFPEWADAKWFGKGGVLDPAVVGGQVKRGFASTAAGVRQIGEDLGIAQPGEAAAVRKEIEAERQEELPKNMSIAQEGVMSGLASIPEMAITALPGLGPLFRVTTAPRALGIALGTAGGMEAAREYGEQRDYGMSPLRAGVHAGVAGGAEALGEYLPMKYAFDKFGERALGKFVGGLIGRDIVGEELTYLIQSANEKLSTNPDMTLGEFARGAGVTAIAAATGSGIMGSAAKGVEVAANTAYEMKLRSDLNRIFKNMAEGVDSAPTGPQEPFTEASHTENAQRSYVESLKKFQRMNIPQDLWMDYAEKFAPDFAVTTAPMQRNANPEQVQALLTDALETNPNKFPDYVVSNLSAIANAGVDVQSFIAEQANAGKIDDKTATKLMADVDAKVQQAVDTLWEDTVTERDELSAAQELFAASEQTKARPEGEVYDWAKAFTNIGVELAGDPGKKFSADELRAYGLPDLLARPIARLSQPKQKAVIERALPYFRTLLEPTGSDHRTAASMIGDFSFYEAGLTRPTNSFSSDLTWYLAANPNTSYTFGPNLNDDVSLDNARNYAAGTVNTVDTSPDNAKVDPKVIKRLTAITRAWVRKHAPGMVVVLNVHSHNTGSGGHQVFAGAGQQRGVTVHELDIKVKPGDSLEWTLSVLAHEFGHAMFIRQYHLAPQKLREVLRQEWLKNIFVENWNTPTVDVLRTNKANWQNWDVPKRPVRRIVADQVVGMAQTASGKQQKAADYWLNFLEWHAHMMERMLASDYAGLQGPVKTFWRKAFDRLQKFFNAEHKLWAPNQTISEFLQLMAKNEQTLRREREVDAMLGRSLAAGITNIKPGDRLPPPIPAPISPDNQREEFPGRYTLQIFKVLQPRPKYSKQQIEQLLKMQTVTAQERELVQRILSRFDGNVIPHDRLVAEFAKEIEKLTLARTASSRWADYGLESIGAYPENGSDAAEVIKYQTPFEIPHGNHFSDNRLFGWVRRFFRDNITHIVEIQSDLVSAVTGKKTKMPEADRLMFTEYHARLGKLNEDSVDAYNDYVATERVDKLAQVFTRAVNDRYDGNDMYDAFEDLASVLNGGFIRTLGGRETVGEAFIELLNTAQPNHIRDAVTHLQRTSELRAQEIALRLGNTTPNIEAIKPLMKNWWKRLVREELHSAYVAGQPVVRFGTPDTVAKVEGWPRRRELVPGQYFNAALANIITIGRAAYMQETGFSRSGYTGRIEVYGGVNGAYSYEVAEFGPDLLPTGRTKWVSMLVQKDLEVEKALLTEGGIKESGFVEQEHQNIYDRYRDIEKFLLAIGGQRITDNKGHTWIEVPTKAQKQVEVFSPDKPPIMQDFTTAMRHAINVFNRNNPQHGPGVSQSLVKFNEFWAKLLGSFQILELNQNVPGATRFLNALRAKFGYKSLWLGDANKVANLWEGLGKERAGALAKLLLTEAETDTWYSERMPDPNRPGHYIFVLQDEYMKQFKIDEETAEVYSKVRDMYMTALDAMEQLGKERIARQFGSDPTNPQMQQQLDELTASYANMRSRPYTPFSRFGQFYVKIRAKDNGIFKDPITNTTKLYSAGQTVYFETFETAAERDRALPELQKRYGNSPMLDAQFNTGKIHDIVFSVRNLPPQFVRSIAERLDLSQEQLQEYNEIIKDLASDSSFVKHMKRKANISGYSPDTLRGFADYFLRFSNNYAKGRSAPELEAAMADVREYKRQLEDSQLDTTKLDEFYNWLQRTFNYVMNPGNELAELKSFVTAWYLGFNIPTAVQNITQLPFWTLPYLSKRFGTPKSLNALKTALGDVLGSWKSLDRLSADEKAMMTHALEQGFIDESFATSIAQFAEGTALTRLTATATRHRLLNWYNHKSLWMFQKAEEINRRTSLLAAYRLNRTKGFTGEYDAAAFLKAREAVEVTQNEYALENRPEFMRGNWSVIFQFMHYVQNAIFRMTPWGDDSWKRILLMQLAVAGLLGLPFAEDILNAGKFIARRFGIAWEPELMMRQLLLELGIAPDLVLRGAMAHLGPFDLSFRYSLGKVVPGMEAVGSNQRFNDAILNAVGDVGGAGATILLNALKAVASLEDPNRMKTLEYISPSFVKYVLQALKANEEGGVIARNGALIAPLNQGEILGMTIGLQPAAKARAYKRIGFEMEVSSFWMTRRAMVMQTVHEALRTDDREARADAFDRLHEYNKEVMKVDPRMTINVKELQRSIRQRFKVRTMQETLGSPNRNYTLTRTIRDAVPEPGDELE